MAGFLAALPAIASVAGTAYGLFGGGSKSGSNAAYQLQKSMLREQYAAMQKQNQLYEQSYLPIERALAGQAAVGAPAQYLEDRAGIDVRRTFDNSVGSYRRGMGRLGINPADPRYATALANLSLLRASAEAGARTGARDKAREETWLRRLQAANIGRGIGNAVQSGMNNLSNQYGNLYTQQVAREGAQDSAAGNIAEWASNGGVEKLGKDVEAAWGGIKGLFST